MGNWYCGRSGKFYSQQVEQILALIKRSFIDTGIDIDKYLAVCEQLNQEPDPEKMPPSMDSFPLEVQEAFFLHRMLSDRWDGSSGFYMGKDLSALKTYLDVYKIFDPQQTLYFLKHIEHEHSSMLNEKVKKEHEAAKRKLKMKKQ